MLRRFFGAIRTYYNTVIAWDAPAPKEISSTRLLRLRRHERRLEQRMLAV